MKTSHVVVFCIFGIVGLVVFLGICLTLNSFTASFRSSETAFSGFVVFLLTFLQWALIAGGILGFLYCAARVYWATHKTLAPTTEGNYPALITPTRRTITIEAGNGPVPGSYHFHQEITGGAYTAPALPAPTEITEIEAPPIEQPGMDEMYEAVKYNSLEVAFGVTADAGKIITVNITKGVHFKLVGGSGFGKSCLAAALMDIAITRNDPDHLRIALLDLEHKTSRLFEQFPHVMEVSEGRRRIPLLAGDADDVARKLALLRKELDRRASGQVATPLLLIYVEEMLSLQYEVDSALKEQMLADLAIIALRGRKYGMFLLACTQTDYSTKELKEAQKQFRTRSGFAIDPSAARAAGFVNNELVKYNFRNAKPGQYLLEQPAFSELMLAPLYDIEAKLQEMSNPGTLYRAGYSGYSRPYSGSQVPRSYTVPDDAIIVPQDGDKPDNISPFPARGNGPEPLNPEKLQLVRNMLAQHKSQSEIVAAAFPGMRNSDAITAFRKYVAALVSA